MRLGVRRGIPSGMNRSSTTSAFERSALPALLLAACATAHAQVYSGIDQASGAIVLSNFPSDLAPTVVVAPPAVEAPRQETPAPVVRDERAQPIAPLIDGIAREYGLNHELLHAVVEVESGYNPFAVSPRGAMGLMQLMRGPPPGP